MATANDCNNGVGSLDVVIVGGGISGLSAAYDILKENKDCKILILEAKGIWDLLYWSFNSVVS